MLRRVGYIGAAIMDHDDTQPGSPSRHYVRIFHGSAQDSAQPGNRLVPCTTLHSNGAPCVCRELNRSGMQIGRKLRCDILPMGVWRLLPQAASVSRRRLFCQANGRRYSGLQTSPSLVIFRNHQRRTPAFASNVGLSDRIARQRIHHLLSRRIDGTIWG